MKLVSYFLLLSCFAGAVVIKNMIYKEKDRRKGRRANTYFEQVYLCLKKQHIHSNFGPTLWQSASP